MSTALTGGTRTLGTDGPEVSALGVGTWALGGPFTADGRGAGWGEVDDDVSVAALPGDRRDGIVVATKFGNTMDEATRTGTGQDVSPAAVRAECEGSLRRLGVEAIDLYQLHGGVGSRTQAEDVVATLIGLVDAGRVRAFGAAQDAPEVVEVFATSPHCRAVQSQLDVFGWQQPVLDAAHRHGLAVLARSPLALGLLSGKYTPDRRPAPGDVRLGTPWWDYFDEGSMATWLTRLDRVRELLTVGGRSLVQGSLCYLWSVDDVVIPLPGIRTPAQAAENAGALAYGPLPADVAAEVTSLLADSPERR